jgi:hypothetical protein
MKCRNSASECTRFESNYNSPTGRSSDKIYVTAEQWGRSGKRKGRMKLNLSAKIDGFLSFTLPLPFEC